MGGFEITSCPLRNQVDPRALRFAAGATAIVLAVVLLTVGAARPLALGLLASQVAVFGFTAFVSVQWSVWAQLFARVVWPRIGAATQLVDARSARFAQLLGFVLTAVALVGFVLGADGPASALIVVVVAAAAVDAATGRCAGCAIYRLARRRRSHAG